MRAGEVPIRSDRPHQHGRAKVTNSDEEGREIILAMLGPGESFGEMGLIDGSPRSADVVALEASEPGARPRRIPALHEGQLPGRLKLMQVLVRRLREADRKIESLALLDVYGRVARLLLEMSELVDGGKRASSSAKVSKQDMARMIGASREMVSKVCAT